MVNATQAVQPMFAHATQPTSSLRRLLGGAGLCLLFLATALGLLAQSVHWDPPGGTLPYGLLSEITLTFENCEPKGDPAPPKVQGLMLALRGRSENISISNFTKTSSIIYSFAVRLEVKQDVTIPSFTVETGKGPVTVPSVRFTQGQASIGQSNLSIEDIAQSRFIPGSSTVWAGEVFPLVYRLDVLTRYLYNLGGVPEWDASPLFVEEWSKPERRDAGGKGDGQSSILYQTRAYVKDPGQVTLNGAQQLVNIRTGTSMSFFGASPELQQLSITSDQPTITVRPLPTPAPTSFGGAVGQFKLASRVVPQKARAGEPITWTLELSGTGNWPVIQGLPPRSVPKAFDVVTPQAKRTTPEGKTFDATISEDIVMIPRQPGNYVIPPLSFSYFDPKAGAYRTLTTERVQLVVEAAAVPANAATAAAPAKTPSGDAGAPPAPPSPPSPLPSDPVQGGTLAEVPRELGQLPYLCLLPLALVPLAWLGLACARAGSRDPLHPRRRAHATLRRLFRDPPANESQKRRMVRAWQEQVARAFGLPAAAPSARQLSGLLREQNIPSAKDWLELWSQADAYLFGQGVPLPVNWADRAAACLKELRIPPFNPLRSFLPRHLLPWFFAGALLLALLPAQKALAIPGAAELYGKGDFAGAAAQWEGAVRAHPTDWAARHNLGLALLQQNQPGPAAAHLAAALVQNPSEEAVRRNFLLASAQAGFTPARVGELAAEHPLSALARLASPAAWQWLLGAASVLALAAALLYLCFGYGLRFRFQRSLAAALAGLALLLAGSSLLALARYGPLADPRAAFVRQNSTLRSIPTEADATQKTSAIQAGSLLVVDRTFLGWRHITLPGGDTGWLRQSDLVPLWTAE